MIASTARVTRGVKREVKWLTHTFCWMSGRRHTARARNRKLQINNHQQPKAPPRTTQASLLIHFGNVQFGSPFTLTKKNGPCRRSSRARCWDRRCPGSGCACEHGHNYRHLLWTIENHFGASETFILGPLSWMLIGRLPRRRALAIDVLRRSTRETQRAEVSHIFSQSRFHSGGTSVGDDWNWREVRSHCQ